MMINFFNKLLNHYLSFQARPVVADKRKSKSNNNKTSLFLPLLLGLVLCFTITLMFPRARSFQFSDLQVGDIYIGEEVIAPFDFPILKSEEQLKLDKEDRKNKVSYVFLKSDSLTNMQIKWLENFFQTIHIIRDSSIAENQKIEILSNLLKNYNIIISDENLASLLFDKTQKDSESSLISFEKKLLELNKKIYSIGILDIEKKDIKTGNGKISVIYNGEEELEEITYYFNLEDAKRFLKDETDKLAKAADNEVLAKLGYQIVASSLIPNVIFDQKETENRIQQAINSVPLATGMVLADERIIDTHDKVREEQLLKLKSLAVAKAELAESEGGLQLFLPFSGKFLLVGLSLVLFGLFLFHRKRRLLVNSTLILLVFLIVLLVVFLSFVLNNLGLSQYLLPITIASMLLTIFIDLEVGFIGTIALSMILGALRGNDFNVVIVSIFAGGIAVVSVNKVRTRNWLLRSLLLIIGAYVVSISALEFLRYPSFHRMLESVGYGVINGLISPILAYGLTVIIESTFDLITDMKLLELSDLNKPLLRELAMKAPGTYFHSTVVGSLSEAAAEAIGANSLLARVGAYYHDIGKILNPKYFIENQNRGAINPHERLAPTMSSLILVNHVRKGVELAKKYNLPNIITDFINQHHGTSLMNPFYKKAIEQNKTKGDEINESSFRYPGPRPKSKETGIVMLADAIEAASRTLKDPTVSRIQAMVNSIIRERFTQSELDECPLTLSDLHKIGEQFQKFLIGMFHARVEYPDQEEKFFRRGKLADV